MVEMTLTSCINGYIRVYIVLIWVVELYWCQCAIKGKGVIRYLIRM